MKHHNLKRFAAVGLGAGALVLLAGSPAFPAVFSTSPPASLSVGTSGQIVARGAAVYVPVSISCSPGTSSTSVTVTVTERVGGQVARGVGTVMSPVVCDNGIHTVSVQVSAAGKVFKKGVAAVTADFRGGGPAPQVDLTDSATIPIK